MRLTSRLRQSYSGTKRSDGEDQIQLGNLVFVSLESLRVGEVLFVRLENGRPMDNRVEWRPFLEKDINELIGYKPRSCFQSSV